MNPLAKMYKTEVESIIRIYDLKNFNTIKLLMKKFCGKEHELYDIVKSKFIPENYVAEPKSPFFKGYFPDLYLESC